MRKKHNAGFLLFANDSTCIKFLTLFSITTKSLQTCTTQKARRAKLSP